MGLANLANVPRSDSEWSVYTFSNQAAHFDVQQAILNKLKATLPLYPVDPINFDDPGQWIQNHQQMHNAVNGVLGTPGADLTGINFRDLAQVEAWVFLHFTEHATWARILG